MWRNSRFQTQSKLLRDRRRCSRVCESVNWTRGMEFRVRSVSMLQAEAPQGVFCIDSSLSGIFSLHPVRHSCARALWPGQWHTHKYTHTNKTLTRHKHTHVQPCKTHTVVGLAVTLTSAHCLVWPRLWSDTKEGSRSDALSGNRGASLGVAMVTLMSCACVCVCVHIPCRVWGWR